MAKGDIVHGAHNDDTNQAFSMLGVIGTLGTADVKGSALTLPVGVEESTGAMYVYNLGPAGTTTPAGTQDVNIVSGTVVTSMGDLTGGTIDILTDGTVGIKGTVPVSGTVTTSMGDLTGGTIDIITDGTIGIKGTVPVSGTVTTSMGDLTGGTIDQITTGSIVVTAGTVTTTMGDITGGTIDLLSAGTIDTVSNITNGSIVVTAGTVTTTLGDLVGGTIDEVTLVKDGTVSVNTPGTITSGSIAVTAGSVVGTVSVATPGTITSGSISVIAGTIGTVTNIGTLDMLKAGTIDKLAGGTIDMFKAGTVTRVSNLINGTVRVTAGTIESGTINTGTINAATINAGTIKNDGRVARNILSYATSVALGGTAYGTVIGSALVGVGTSVWVNDVSILNEGGTVTAAVGFGTENQGTAVLWRGILGPREGIQKSYPMPVNCGMTNKDLTVYALQAATVDVAVSYFISA
jgi:hypothetical protein